MPRTLELTGNIFGRLTVMSKHGTDRNGFIMWDCQCECGNKCVVRGAHLNRKAITSCGCLRIEVSALTRFQPTHGLTHNALYSRWRGIKQRCYDPKVKCFRNYGGRGIRVCDRWIDSVEAFIEDMGSTYQAGLQLERIDNDGDYSPENCRWATAIEQSRNKRTNKLLTINGETKTQIEWAVSANLAAGTFASRIKHGWSLERALSTPSLRAKA